MDRSALAPLKRHYSSLGMACFLYLAVSTMAQGLVAGICAVAAPQLLETGWFLLAASFLPMYLIGFPIFCWRLPKAPAVLPAPRTMPVKDLLICLLMCFGLLYPLNLLGSGVTALLNRLLGTAQVNPIAALVDSANPWLYALFAVVLGPIMEELTFRKLLIDRMRTIDKPAAVLFSALAFGLFHGNLSQFFYAFALGIFFGFLYVKTGRIRYTIVLHILVNFFGSMVTMLLLPYIDMAALDSVTLGAADALGALLPSLPALLGLAVYGLCMLSAAIAGIALLISRRKRFQLADEADRLSPAQRFRLPFLNPGMALYILAAAVVFALSLG